MKNICKLLVAILVITLMPSSVFATESTNYEYMELAKVLEDLGQAEIISSDTLSDGSKQVVIEYSNGVVSKVNEKISADKTYLTFDEGDIHDEVVIDNIKQEMFLNGNKVTYTKAPIIDSKVSNQLMVTTNNNIITPNALVTWYGHTSPAYGIPDSAYTKNEGTEFYNVTLGAAIKSITLGAYASAVCYAVGWGGIATAVTGAFVTVLEAARSYYSTDYNANFYLTIHSSVNTDWPSRKFTYKFYSNSGKYIATTVCYATCF
ncbi:hypothetical protein [Clostridium aminobutyricum]|uniref:Uncharacterized protein n=1 Tax=Clostridium aminobutyricum TaxID=33953 RepID=A0A939D902_CLOAM|nr:hypothetical protein [Clostridium aminobutyricum]MBN7773361.1 hypothetical protein [Clostridium aminobutyricum]